VRVVRVWTHAADRQKQRVVQLLAPAQRRHLLQLDEVVERPARRLQARTIFRQG
jgi:hypothetical protein